MKRSVIACVLLVVIAGLSFLSYFCVHGSIRVLREEAEALESLAGEEQLAVLQKEWTKQKKTLLFFCPNTEIYEIDLLVASLDSLFHEEEKANFYASIQMILTRLTHIERNEAPELTNIF